MEIYLNKSEACETIGLQKQTLYDWMRAGRFIEPDVSVGRKPGGRVVQGYSRQRVIAFGQLCRLLDADGRAIPLGSGPQRCRPKAPYPSWWYVDTAHYLSKMDLAEMWGVTKGAIEMRAYRGRMPAAAVAVGVTGGAVVYGFTEDEVNKFARQHDLPAKMAVP